MRVFLTPVGVGGTTRKDAALYIQRPNPMRNTIPCTAGRIALLEPSMIQAIVEQKAFQRGHEYFKESRVRLLEADDTDIAATVRGNSGIYEQTIRLREGTLVTACSCSLIEQPMCRHCVAVLLEYHRWSSQRTRRDAGTVRESRNGLREGKEIRPTDAGSNGKSTASQEQDVRLSEVIAFVQWAQPAMRSLSQNAPLPDSPRLPDGMVADWVQTICALHARQREHEAVQQDLHADLAQRDVQLQELREQLKTAQAGLAEARQTNQGLERDVAKYQGVMTKLKELSESIARFDGDMKTVAGDLGKSHHQFEGLVRSFHEVSLALQNIAKPRTG